ncbi:ras and Rab interactor 3 [Nerophis lumbriciformis]|uniref:ras and Rab interactor 3 n=1 Tax=Nerophis lumbriciformis TaxID=546530 RepID=UPI002AE0681A|nr:ras and Rab interactor 3-like [Nerophis lumbriciformis]
MMEASLHSEGNGHADTPQSSPLSPPSIPVPVPSSRPGRPKPPPPTVKTSLLPSRPPPPPFSLPLASKPTSPLPSYPPSPSPSSLPPPLSPKPCSVSPSTFILPEPPPSFVPPPPRSPQALSPSLSSCPNIPTLILPPSPTPPVLSFRDRLVESTSVWLTRGLSREQIGCILEKETAGAFLVQSTEDQNMTLSVRVPENQDASPVQNLNIQEYKTFLHLDGSSLVFDDIYKLVSFYCVSRDILAAPLNLPQAITLAKQREDLEVISALGTDFWTSAMNEKTQGQNLSLDQSHNNYLYINPIALEEKSNKKSKDFADSTEKIKTPQSIISSLRNGNSRMKETLEGKGQIKILPRDSKVLRAPPRPPSSGLGPVMGLLFSPLPLDRMEEEIVEAQDKEGSKSPPPLRPPAPLRPNSSRNSSDGTEKEPKPLIGTKPEGLREEENTLLDEAWNNKYQEVAQQFSPQPLVKRPSPPVPQPRKKPSVFESANQTTGMRVGPPTLASRPDVSPYSPQGATVFGTDLDSGSNSSTEEEDLNQSQDKNSNNTSESRQSKVKRTPTPTFMLDRARTRLSMVLTGLISHDRRLSQRIVELARNPLSYFGNLVNDHRTFTLETMSNHSTSSELLQEIRQMMTQLKSYLLQSTELETMMDPQHQCSKEKLESIVEAALCKSVLKPLREPIYENLERLQFSNGSLKQMAQKQSVVLGSTTTALGVTTAVPETSAMEKISIKFSNLHLEYSPQKKIELLLKACKIIYDSMSVSSPGRAHGADDFLPVMMYVLGRSNLAALMLDVEYMMELMDPALTIGEGSYYLTTTYGALEHIKEFDQQKSAPRQLSREVQDSIQRWERRRTVNLEGLAPNPVQEFLTVFSPEIGRNPKTFAVLPTTSVQQLAEECSARFQQDSYILSVHVDGVLRSPANTELALAVKNQGFIYHPADQSDKPSVRTCPTGPPPRPPTLSNLKNIPDNREAEESLIYW